MKQTEPTEGQWVVRWQPEGTDFPVELLGSGGERFKCAVFRYREDSKRTTLTREEIASLLDFILAHGTKVGPCR